MGTARPAAGARLRKKANIVLKIAVNTRLLLPGKLEGIGWFTYESFRRIVHQHPEHRFYFLFDRPFSEEFVFSSNVEPVVLFPPARHPILYYLFFEQAVPRRLNRLGVDLFVSPDGFLSGRFKGPQLPVFHDLNFMHRPEFLPWMTRTHYRRFFPAYAKIARRIATVSEYSKRDIVRSFGYPETKIDVVYNGVNDLFSPIGEDLQQATRDEFTGGSPYFIYIGALHKRKNIGQMLRAFERFRHHHGQAFKLVIIGAPMFSDAEPEKVLQSMRYREEVLFLGRQYGETLRRLLASARALLLVSHFEGFGIPIIEAMQCDVPAIVSDTTSMPEVAGDAALLIDPGSVAQIADAMTRMARDEQLRTALVEKGRVQRERFSWDKTAASLWASMTRCL